MSQRQIRQTRAAKAREGTALMRGLLLGEDGFSAQFLSLMFETFGLHELPRAKVVCKHLRDAANEVEDQWEILGPPMIVKVQGGLVQPLCVEVLPDSQVAIGSYNAPSPVRPPSMGLTLLNMQSGRKRSLCPYGTSPGESYVVSSVAYDHDGEHLIIADRLGHRVQKLKLADGAFVAEHVFAAKSRVENLVFVEGNKLLYVVVNPSGGGRTAYVAVLDPQTLARKGSFGAGMLFGPRCIDEYGGLLYIADSGTCYDGYDILRRDQGAGVAVFTVAGDFVRFIPLNRRGQLLDFQPAGLVITEVGREPRLIVCGNRVEPGRTTRSDVGEVQVLTLEGSLRDYNIRPNVKMFGGMSVSTDEDGNDRLFLVHRGSSLSTSSGQLFVIPLIS